MTDLSDTGKIVLMLGLAWAGFAAQPFVARFLKTGSFRLCPPYWTHCWHADATEVVLKKDGCRQAPVTRMAPCYKCCRCDAVKDVR